MTVTTATGQTVIEEGAVRTFKSGFRGELLRPRDDAYDTARKIFNGMIDSGLRLSHVAREQLMSSAQ